MSFAKRVARAIAGFKERACAALSGIAQADAVELLVVARHRFGVLDGGERTQELVHALGLDGIGAFFGEHPLGAGALAIADEVVGLLSGGDHHQRDLVGVGGEIGQHLVADFGARLFLGRRDEGEAAEDNGRRRQPRPSIVDDPAPLERCCAAHGESPVREARRRADVPVQACGGCGRAR